MRGWYIVMQNGGYLKPHMHEGGWLSGSIYLKIPKNNKCVTLIFRTPE